MCQSKEKGGKRCQYSTILLQEKRKLQRTQKYRDEDVYTQTKMEKEFLKDFQKTHSEAFKEHLPDRAKWQTKAKPLSEKDMEKLSKKFFSKPAVTTQEAAATLSQKLLEERKLLEENISQGENYTLDRYAMVGHERVNNLLRGDLKKIASEYYSYKKVDPEVFTKDMKMTRKEIADIDSVFEKSEDLPKASEFRTLYRHHIVPSGIGSKEFAEKYFKIGERISDPAFLSTTEDPSYIAGHVNSRKPTEYVVYQIVSKKGVTLIQEERESSGNVQQWEKERLLPRETKFRVVAIRKDKFGVDPERGKMAKYFGGSHWRPIKDRYLTVIQLIDEDEI